MQNKWSLGGARNIMNAQKKTLSRAESHFKQREASRRFVEQAQQKVNSGQPESLWPDSDGHADAQ